MAARPGEEVTAILFADIHYFYGSPKASPPHHRFDKGSYVYLFEDAAYRRARIEVANNPGTEDQDAFDGYLDSTHIAYSYKQPNLITVTVGAPSTDPQEWHLPTFDPHNENKYMYRLHTLDIYFWTPSDARIFVDGVRRILAPHQLSIQIQDQPQSALPPQYREEMSPIVQKLESVAISDPSYQDGKTRDSRGMSFPGRPAASPVSQEPSFLPMAYNPAAPAAPEVILHREKTPPPEDGAGNPLVAAAVSDHGISHSQSFGGTPTYNIGGFSGPPVQTPSSATGQNFGGTYSAAGFSGPPVQTPTQQQSYFPGSPAPASAPVSSTSQSQVATPQSPYAQYFQNSFAGPPTAASQDSIYAQPPPPPSTAPPQPSYTTAAPPPGGFAQYQYNSNTTSSSRAESGLSNTKPLMTDYSIHQEVYRPTQMEATRKAKPVKVREGGPRGKLEDRAEKLERGMGSIFKKLERKIG